jgi:hypothetical protein
VILGAAIDDDPADELLDLSFLEQSEESYRMRLKKLQEKARNGVIEILAVSDRGRLRNVIQE